MKRELPSLAYVITGDALARVSSNVLRAKDTSIEEADAFAREKGVKCSFWEGDSRYRSVIQTSGKKPRIVSRKVTVPFDFRSGKCNLSTAAHELGHAELENKYLQHAPWLVGKSRHLRRIFLLAPVMAGMMESRRGRALVLMGTTPVFVKEGLASYYGGRILHEKGKLTRRRAVELLMPVVNRAGLVVELYGVGRGAKHMLRWVRGYVRRQGMKRVPVSGYWRRVL